MDRSLNCRSWGRYMCRFFTINRMKRRIWLEASFSIQFFLNLVLLKTLFCHAFGNKLWTFIDLGLHDSLAESLYHAKNTFSGLNIISGRRTDLPLNVMSMLRSPTSGRRYWKAGPHPYRPAFPFTSVHYRPERYFYSTDIGTPMSYLWQQ